MAATKRRHRFKAVRIARAHDRLLLSAAIGLVAFLISAYGLGTALLKSGLIGWIVGVATYLGVALSVIRRFDIKRVQRRAASQDEGGIFILALTVIAATASLAAIAAQIEAANAPGVTDRGVQFALAAITILLSWTFIHTIFAFHYAHEYYGERGDGIVGGLVFPDDDKPDYWDFIYFSFVIGMTFQVSDVQITSKLVRRIAVAHGFVAFIFNVAILALVVNIGGNILNHPAPA